ncbi:hypothetical protein [Hymenobacter sp. UYP22]|uniref:phosphoribosyltransferase-like protein n=1 Tax=Hymenobacter sp. UYP22 TaxID=3156348 RepID=UPI0033961C0E
MEPLELFANTQLEIITQADREQAIRERYAFLRRIGLWPRQMQPEQWLENFIGADELEVAYDLLKNFMYYPKDMLRELQRCAIRKIMPYVLDFTGSAAEAKTTWASVARRMIIVPVQDDVTPSSADSGYNYARLARETFDLLPRQVPKDFMDLLLSWLQLPEDGLANVVVFVDDFVGSGSQFIKTWHQIHPLQPELEMSCHTIAPYNKTKFFYCPLIATSYGLDRIRKACGTSLTLCPAHILGPEANALHPRSRIWSNDEIRQKGIAVLKQIATRVPMPNTGGRRATDWQGFHQLGLNLVLDDSMPDACLGVFRFDKHRWHPLYNKAV